MTENGREFKGNDWLFLLIFEYYFFQEFVPWLFRNMRSFGIICQINDGSILVQTKHMNSYLFIGILYFVI